MTDLLSEHCAPEGEQNFAVLEHGSPNVVVQDGFSLRVSYYRFPQETSDTQPHLGADFGSLDGLDPAGCAIAALNARKVHDFVVYDSQTGMLVVTREVFVRDGDPDDDVWKSEEKYLHSVPNYFDILNGVTLLTPSLYAEMEASAARYAGTSAEVDAERVACNALVTEGLLGHC